MLKRILYSLLSALLLSLGWLEMSGITLLIALVPLLFVSDSFTRGGKREWWQLLLCVSIALGTWSGVTTWWIWYAAPIGAILSVIITILLFGGIFMLYHYVKQRASRALAYTILVCGWIAMEILYTYGEISFPWLMLGNGFANDVRLIQWYEYTGVFGGSLWILLCNVAIYNCIRNRWAINFIATALLIALPVTASMLLYYNYDETGRDVKVQIVQPNIDPYDDKFTVDQDIQNGILLECAAKAPSDVEFIVMPETAIDDRLDESALNHSESLAQLRQFLTERYPSTQIITGATTYRFYAPGKKISTTARTNDNIDFWYDAYNTALTVDTTQRVQTYHKTKLVVGVEKLPYYGLLKHLDFLTVNLGGISGQLGVDSVRTVFTSPRGTRIGAAICYEGIYGSYFTEFARNGAQLMSIISNDGWWDDTPGHRQLVGFSRLRAIESRRAIARSANTGVSVAINQRGDILTRSEWWTKDSLTTTLKTNDKITFYTLYGDLIGRICVYTFLLCLLYYVAYRTRKRSHLI